MWRSPTSSVGGVSGKPFRDKWIKTGGETPDTGAVRVAASGHKRGGNLVRDRAWRGRRNSTPNGPDDRRGTIMARPTLLTDELALEICANLELGISIKDACWLSGIDERTYHYWVKWGKEGKDPYFQFFQCSRRARASGRRKHVLTLTGADDWRASLAFLERSDPKNWGRRGRVKVDHQGRGAQVWADHEEPTQEERREAEELADAWMMERFPG